MTGKTCGECGATVPLKRDRIACAKCAGRFCPRHIFSRIDGNNAAITKHAPRLCRPCYLAAYTDEA